MNKFRAILRRRWPVLVVTLVLGGLAGYFSANAVGPERETTQYQADQVIVANRLSGNPANVPQDSLKVTRGEVPELAAEILAEEDSAALARKVKVSDETDSSSISLRVYDTDPERASEIVQAFTQAFLQVVNAELRSEDQRQLEQLSQRLTDAEAALTAFDEENGFISRPDVPLPQTPTVDALVAERARLAQAARDAQANLEAAELEISEREPYSTLGPERPRVAESQLLEVPESPLFRAGLLGFIGLLLGIGLIIVIERVNRRVDTRDELAELLDIPIIAEIGRIRSRNIPSDEEGVIDLEGAWSEHYRRVRSAIEFVQAQALESAAGHAGQANGAPVATQAQAAPPRNRRESPVIAGHGSGSTVPRTFMFVSALPGEGKSTSVALTALAMAEAGDNVLALSADFRRPKLEKYLGMQRDPSVADLAELSVNRPTVNDVVHPGRIPHLWTAAAGKPTTEVTGRLAAAREVAVEAAAQEVTVLLDSSPLRVSNDPVDLLSVADEVILVVRAGRSTVKSLEDTVELLEMHHAPVMGVVLIGTLATRELYAYYASYYREMDEVGKQKRGWGRRRHSSGGPDPDGVPGSEDVDREEPVNGDPEEVPEEVLVRQRSVRGEATPAPPGPAEPGRPSGTQPPQWSPPASGHREAPNRGQWPMPGPQSQSGIVPPPHPLLSQSQPPPANSQRIQSATAVDRPNENRR